ncbi:hypothetical protein BAUCODRAFT_150274 [Baudoinia panamericana UAMH 10762]|uniref:Uncharacterized protein n=1 Tax=Baudoinia panamericana (strain UAMH 10762) TaxID=717646 RepID=M2MRG9_BAUPA|nr:uncharacterized protein BAUCODRAFT_150274 [Baudoinia panamericana UAMH 10762]EMC94053.1 hypothetical protein BAUCODRAFT_150274 [Baudoinia panamericana UAMH 10762]
MAKPLPSPEQTKATSVGGTQTVLSSTTAGSYRPKRPAATAEGARPENDPASDDAVSSNSSEAAHSKQAGLTPSAASMSIQPQTLKHSPDPAKTSSTASTNDSNKENRPPLPPNGLTTPPPTQALKRSRDVLEASEDHPDIEQLQLSNKRLQKELQIEQIMTKSRRSRLEAAKKEAAKIKQRAKAEAAARQLAEETAEAEREQMMHETHVTSVTGKGECIMVGFVCLALGVWLGTAV